MLYFSQHYFCCIFWISVALMQICFIVEFSFLDLSLEVNYVSHSTLQQMNCKWIHYTVFFPDLLSRFPEVSIIFGVSD